MRRYLRIYKMLLHLNFASLVAYRANFVNSLISSIAWAAFSLFSVILLTGRTPNVYGWSRNEIILLTGSYNIIVGIFHMVFSRNFQRFSTIVHYGRLDSILTKPLDSQFLLSFWLVAYTSVIRVCMGIAINIYILTAMGLQYSVLDIMFFILMMLLGIMLLYSLWLFVITLTIWFTRLSNLVDLLYTMNGVTRYPPKMVNEAGNFFSYILIPFTFVVAPPTRLLLQKALSGEIVGLAVLSISFFILSRLFFRYALKFYTSASN